MDRRFLTVLGVSLLFALVVSSLFWQMTSKPGPTAAAPPPSETKDVVVAAKSLPLGVTVKLDDLKVEKRPIDQFPKGAFTKVEEVVGRPVISNIVADEPVLAARLAEKGSGIGLAPIIPVGMRAVTVRVNDEAGVAGFVLPKMKVDVLVTGTPPGGRAGTMTTTCLQNMEVLSAGTVMEADPSGKAIPAPSVTLLSTPQQAEILTLASSVGGVKLVLRNGADNGIEKTSGSRVEQIYNLKVANVPLEGEEGRPRRRVRPVVISAAPAPLALPVPMPPPPPPQPEVVVFRGPQKSVEMVAPARTDLQ